MGDAFGWGNSYLHYHYTLLQGIIPCSSYTRHFPAVHSTEY
jgi:hypothetical protein